MSESNKSDFENMMFGELDSLIREAQEGDFDSTERLSEYIKYFAKTDEWKQLKEALTQLKETYEKRKDEEQESSIRFETDEKGNEIVSIDVTKKRKHISPNDIISNNLYSNPDYMPDFENPDKQKKIMVTDSKGNELGIAFGLTAREGDRVLKVLTPMTRLIHDGICSLIETYPDRDIFTMKELYLAIPSCSGTLPPRIEHEIENALYDFRYIEGAITNKIEAENGDYALFTRRAPLLHWEWYEGTVMIGGNLTTQKAVRIIKKPLLLEFAQSRKQVMKVDSLLYDVPKLPNKIENLELKDYVIHRINMMIQNVKNSRTMSLEPIYQLMQTDKSNRDSAQLVRDKVKKILDHLIECGTIRGYKTLTQGRKITGYEIELFKKVNSKGID